jgi:hypothetical protein
LGFRRGRFFTPLISSPSASLPPTRMRVRTEAYR